MNIDPIILRDLIDEHQRELHGQRRPKYSHRKVRQPGRVRQLTGSALIRLGERLAGRMNRPHSNAPVGPAIQSS